MKYNLKRRLKNKNKKEFNEFTKMMTDKMSEFMIQNRNSELVDFCVKENIFILSPYTFMPMFYRGDSFDFGVDGEFLGVKLDSKEKLISSVLKDNFVNVKVIANLSYNKDFDLEDYEDIDDFLEDSVSVDVKISVENYDKNKDFEHEQTKKLISELENKTYIDILLEDNFIKRRLY